MRIALQNVAAGDPNNDWMIKWNRLLLKNLQISKSDETEIIIQNPKRGLNNFDHYNYSALRSLDAPNILLGIKEAEANGFDAVIVGCFFDPALHAIRQLVDIPVIFLGETSMLLACMMGANFGIITISEMGVPDLQQNVISYGLSSRSLPIKSIGLGSKDQMVAVFNARKQIQQFGAVAQSLVVSGAEVIIPGCMIMSTVLRLAPGCEEDLGPLLQVEGVPVMDIVSVSVKMAEAMMSLKKSGSPWISRKSMYKLTPKESLKEVMEQIQISTLGSWSFGKQDLVK